MYILRDLLVFGPVVFTTLMFRGSGWVLALVVGALLYGAMRFLSALIGLEQAVRDGHAKKSAAGVARRAQVAAVARSKARGGPKRSRSSSGRGRSDDTP